jgi:hypothetical protein
MSLQVRINSRRMPLRTKLLRRSGSKDFLTLSQLGKYFELIKEQRNCCYLSSWWKNELNAEL